MAVEKFPVEASHIMMFARSVGDDNQIYYDEDYAQSTEPGAVIAPPTFVQASAQFEPGYSLRPKVGGDDWFGSGGKPTGVKPKENESGGGGGGGGGLHAEQRYIYHRHPKVGDVLHTVNKPGKTWKRKVKDRGNWSLANRLPSITIKTTSSWLQPLVPVYVPNVQLTSPKEYR